MCGGGLRALEAPSRPACAEHPERLTDSAHAGAVHLSARPLEASRFEVDGIRMAYVFSEDGLAVSVTYAIADPKLRVVGFRLARQKPRLGGTIRGSFFVIKGEYRAGPELPAACGTDTDRLILVRQIEARLHPRRRLPGR